VAIPDIPSQMKPRIDATDTDGNLTADVL